MRVNTAFLANQDYYEIMGLEADATQVELEDAFKQRSADLNLRHPDAQERIQAAELMLSLTQAFETLCNPVLRSQYDLQTLGRNNLPIKEKVDVLFKEGIRAWRKQETDLALRYLKEVSHLYPHRALYRVHLAIAYAEKDWFTFTESELETALRLDPDYKFAKETVAKILFKMPDKHQKRWYHDRLIRQMGPLAAGFVLTGVLIAAGVPQAIFGGFMANVVGTNKLKPKQESVEQQLPADMRQELAEKQATQDTQVKKIPFFEASYVPAGNHFDYSKQEAANKTYYPEQQMVVITYKDGSVLTYRPAELQGWKKQGETPIMITSSNELIPSPTLPLKLPDNTDAKIGSADTPAWMFPEYEQTQESTTNTDSGTSTDLNAKTSTPDTAAESDPTAVESSPDNSAPVETTPEPPHPPVSSAPLYNPYGGG